MTEWDKYGGREKFCWFQGGFWDRVIQFLFYVAAAVFVFGVLSALTGAL